MVLVFLIAGQQGSGKDSLADHLISKYPHLNVEKISFASPLKMMCVELTRAFYDIDFPLEYFHNPIEKEKIRPEFQFQGKPLTLRAVMQHFGTEVCRRFLSPDVWVDAAKAKMKRDRSAIYIVTDCRFQNEVDIFEKTDDEFKAVSFKITGRTSSDALAKHASEAELATMKTTWTYGNTGTLNQLFEAGEAVFRDFVGVEL
jgi:hypothetical protein